VVQQRKILDNLEKRREFLAEDSNKLYDQFQFTIHRDDENGQKLKRLIRNVNKRDQEILDC